MIKTRIRQLISQDLETLIPEGKWREYIDLLDRDGAFTRKKQMTMLITLCQQIEKIEEELERLEFTGPSKETAEVRPIIALTYESIHDGLERVLQTATKLPEVFYINEREWDVLSKAVDPQKAATKPEYGFGKEVDPRDGKEKTCLFHNNLPIFKDDSY
jgi:hypothetical protein